MHRSFDRRISTSQENFVAEALVQNHRILTTGCGHQTGGTPKISCLFSRKDGFKNFGSGEIEVNHSRNAIHTHGPPCASPEGGGAHVPKVGLAQGGGDHPILLSIFFTIKLLYLAYSFEVNGFATGCFHNTHIMLFLKKIAERLQCHREALPPSPQPFLSCTQSEDGNTEPLA